MVGRKKELMTWLGTGTNAKDVGTSISYVYDAVDENDELIDLTLSLQVDAAVQFWLDQKQSKQGENNFDCHAWRNSNLPKKSWTS